MDSYDNSLFAQVFFNWTTNDDDLTIDTAFINAITSSSFEDSSISLVSAVSELVELTSYFSNSITINEQGVTVELSIILDEEIISQFFDSLRESTLITYLLPVAVEVALNIADIETFVDPSLLEISDIDWVQELENVENLYLNLLESGLVEELTSNGVSNPNALIKSLLSEEKYPYVLNAIHSIDNSKLLSRSIVAVMNANIQNNSDVKKYFSMTAEELCDIRWGFELGVVYDTLYEINKVLCL
jgi:hypothetical protein